MQVDRGKDIVYVKYAETGNAAVKRTLQQLQQYSS